MTKAQKVLKSSRKASAGGILASLAIIVSLLVLGASSVPASPAAALHKDFQRMTYDVYAGGFHVVEARLDVDLSKQTRYRLELGAHTRGFLGRLAPWKGTFETQGWYKKKTKEAQPEIHKSSTVWTDELEVKEYSYNKDGTFKEYRVTDEHSDHEKRDVEQELTQNTTDVLTASLDVMQALAEGNACEGVSEVFDGKRRYRMHFKHQKDVDLVASRYNVYEGPAVECIVEVEPMAGNWHKKPRGWMSIQEQGREKGKLPTVWMAQMSPDGPAVPVKIRVKTDYGTLFMHLTGYQNGHANHIAAIKED